MRLRINLLLVLIVALLFQGCSNESELPQESVSQRTTANNSTSPIETTETPTTSIYKVENNQPEFLFDAESSGQLSTDWRSDLLAELRIGEPDFDTIYVREEWGPGWIDQDFNCINTRHEVLIEESYERPTLDSRGCKVISGKWYDYYSDEFFDDPSELDIDHVVPLHNAHVSGASNWPLETKINFYNDMNDPQHLLVVSSSANRSKGSRGPEIWRPANKEYWCQYAYSWIEIKARWNLSVSEIEFNSLDEMLDLCDGLPELTYWFSNWLLRKGAMSTQEMLPTENEQETESGEFYLEEEFQENDTEITFSTPSDSNEQSTPEEKTQKNIDGAFADLELLDKPIELHPGVHEIWIDQIIEGEKTPRMAFVHVPEGDFRDEELPIIFAFHGNGGEAWDWIEELSFSVDHERFIAVYPQGHFNSWNMGMEESKADDVRFVQLLVELISDYSISDPEKTFAFGVSNGGGIALKIAAETDSFSSVASIITHLWEGQEFTPDLEPTSVIQFSGMEDQLIPYKGGLSPIGHTFLSAEESAYLWAEKNSCEPVPEISIVFEEEGVKRWRWNDCDNATKVEHYAFPGMGHGLSADETEINVNSIIFDFFSFGQNSIATNATSQYDPPLLPVHNSVRDAFKDFPEPEHNPANLHDPSKVVEIDGLLMTAVSGKERVKDTQNFKELYNCGLETWYMYPDKDYFEPGQCLLSEIPDWASQMLPENLGSYWAPAFLDERTIFYTIALWDNEGSEFRNEAAGGCIGVITATGTAPDLKWTDSGAPVTCSRSGEYNDSEPEPEAIDAAVIEHDGKEYLIYGGGHIYALEIDPVTKHAFGDFFWDSSDPRMHHLANGPNIEEDTGETTDGELWVEAAYMEEYEGWFYLFVNWYSCCRGPESTYEIRVGRSNSPTGPFLDKEGTDLRNFGGTLVVDLDGNPEETGPGHAGVFTFEENEKNIMIMTFHYYPTDWNLGDWLEDPLSDWIDGVWNTRTSASPWSYIGAKEIIWEDGWPSLSAEDFDFHRYWDSL